MKFFILVFIFFEGLCLNAYSGDRQKVIDFEGDLVEGLNQRPWDSLKTLSEKDKRRKKAHLYRKRKSFKTETRETLREMRYVP